MNTNDPNVLPDDEKTIRSSEAPACSEATDSSITGPAPKWTQDEAIAFECARECITHLMAIFSEKIHEAESQAVPNKQKISDLNEAQRRLADERRSLRLTNQIEIVRIRYEYSAIVKNYRITGSLGTALSQLKKGLS